MTLFRYRSLSHNEEDVQDGIGAGNAEIKPLNRARMTWRVLLVFLGASVIINIGMVLHIRASHGHHNLDSHVQNFANLQRSFPVRILHDNRTIDDQFWNDPQFDYELGMVALEDSYVQEHGLLSAQRWPWDHTKGIYVVHGFHSLHCVLLLRQSIMEFRDKKEQTWPLPHVTHCLHVLHEDVLCYADDLPRYTGALHDEAGHIITSSGTGQVRMCRDWKQLREWAVRRSACYHRPPDHYIPLLDRYKSCPDGSTP